MIREEERDQMTDMGSLGAAFGALQAEMAALRASEVREVVTATESSGSVTATLDESGQLSALVVDRQWKSAVRPDRLGVACEAAIVAAVTARRELWAENAQRARAGFASASAFGQPAAWTQTQTQPTRDLSDLTPFVEFDKARQLVVPPTELRAAAEAAAASGPVTLTGTPDGRIEVAIDVRWLSESSSAQVNIQLEHAVTAFRSGLQGDVQPDPFAGFKAYNGQLDAAFGDALAHLTNLGRTQ